ncbi:MAG: membrane-associated sensor domain-containing protein [Serratia proteamaculans]
MMKEEGNIEWVGREKRRSTLRNFNWFLLVNVLLALYLLLQRAQTFGERSLSSLLRGAPAICGVVLLSALSFVAIRQLAARGKLASWRGAVVCTALLALCWCGVFHHLIVSDSNNLLYPLTLGLLFSSLIAFYLSPRLFFLFSIPVLLVAIAENIFIHSAFSLVNLISYALMLFLIYSAQSRLEQWFQLAIEREQENKRLIERLSKLAHRDPLTGIANRRYFDTYFDAVLLRESTLQAPFSLILLDVDFFKKYNDHYGHQQGDECLIRLAACLESATRRSQDLVARYGGEEFIILLPKSEAREAAQVAKRIEGLLAGLAMPHADSEVAQWVTVSQGVAQWQPGQNREQLLAAADQALYRAKELGRNGYSIAS